MKKLIDGSSALGIKLNDEQLIQFELYFKELIRNNLSFNLTRVTGYEDVQTRHFLDSLSIMLIYPKANLKSGIKVIDIGSGAGFPGIPFKIAYPESEVTLLEATGKKVLFLEKMIKLLNIQGLTAIKGRAEEAGNIKDYREKFDLVLSRSVAKLNILAELTIPFCKIRGNIVLHKGNDVSQEIECSEKAIRILGGSLAKVIKSNLPGQSTPRSLISIRKILSTNTRFPRRTGIPKKRPL